LSTPIFISRHLHFTHRIVFGSKIHSILFLLPQI
jgi:hypothetical protein